MAVHNNRRVLARSRKGRAIKYLHTARNKKERGKIDPNRNIEIKLLCFSRWMDSTFFSLQDEPPMQKWGVGHLSLCLRGPVIKKIILTGISVQTSLLCSSLCDCVFTINYSVMKLFLKRWLSLFQISRVIFKRVTFIVQPFEMYEVNWNQIINRFLAKKRGGWQTCIGAAGPCHWRLKAIISYALEQERQNYVVYTDYRFVFFPLPKGL